MIPVWLFNEPMEDVLPRLPENSVDTCITDPPYHLTQASRGGSPRKNDPKTPFGRHRIGEAGFMGKTWDGGCISFMPSTWQAVYRVLKPGGYLLAFGGTRVFHRLACAIEDAGFELRDCMMWLHAAGMPKVGKISRFVDKAARGVPHGGPDPTSIAHGKYKGGCSSDNRSGRGFGAGPGQFMKEQAVGTAERSVVQDAVVWAGHSPALRPSWEPILIGMKPLDGNYAGNALKHGVAGFNIEGARIGTTKDVPASPRRAEQHATYGDLANDPGTGSDWDRSTGRWPSNVVIEHADECVCVGEVNDKGYVINRFTDGAKPFGGGAGHKYKTKKVEGGKRLLYACVPQCPVRILDDQAGIRKSGREPKSGFVRNTDKYRGVYGSFRGTKREPGKLIGDTGLASRFFFTPKAPRKDRDSGLLGKLPCTKCGKLDSTHHTIKTSEGKEKKVPCRRNFHATVKPLALMEYLCKLTSTPTGGVVLDPLMGSGSTGVACALTGRPFIGIEKDTQEGYFPIAEARISHASLNGQAAPKPVRKKRSEAKKKKKKRKAKAKS